MKFLDLLLHRMPRGDGSWCSYWRLIAHTVFISLVFHSFFLIIDLLPHTKPLPGEPFPISDILMILILVGVVFWSSLGVYITAANFSRVQEDSLTLTTKLNGSRFFLALAMIFLIEEGVRLAFEQLGIAWWK